MKVIAHRGNTLGPDPRLENRPEFLLAALEQGFDVETDVWEVDSGFALGHDYPHYPVSIEFLRRPGVWCHAKTPETLASLLDRGCHCFFQDKDDTVLTSSLFMVLHVDHGPIDHPRTVVVHLDAPTGLLFEAYGVCTDYCYLWRKACE
jgi:hypothetical protein